MSRHPAPPRRPCVAAFLLASAAVAAPLLLLSRPASAQPAAPEAPSAPETPAAPAESGGLTVPPVPDGTPAELMAFVKGLMPPKAQPRSPQEAKAYLIGVAAASTQVADKILAQVKPEDAEYVAAAKLKLESLMMLGRMGDEQAVKDMATYAATLATSPNPALAREAGRMLLVSEAQHAFTADGAEAVEALVPKVVAMLAADPDDTQSVGLAMQLAGAIEQRFDGEPIVATIYEGIGPLFAKSTNPRVQKLGARCAGTLRRLTLTGAPIEVAGTLLDGTPFDQKSLAGKVVLVDVWATWCGPCRAQIPVMKEAYEKYHDKGFEIVGISLDEDREKLDAFLAAESLPWPIVYSGKGWEDPIVTNYGISGIPQMILVGRDGNVISLKARGPQLAEELEKLFKDAG
ncbi:MAG: TlpA family protein disulfide reductase [Planctomycetaceae bacterium]